MNLSSNRHVFVGCYNQVAYLFSRNIKPALIIAPHTHNAIEPLEEFALRNRIDFSHTKNNQEFDTILNYFGSGGLLLMAACPYRIKQQQINQFERVLNFHPGSLNNNRGATPIIHSILRREEFFTVTLHDVVNEELDCGPTALIGQSPINYETNCAENESRMVMLMAHLGAQVACYLNNNIALPSIQTPILPNSYQIRANEPLIEQLVQAATLNAFLADYQAPLEEPEKS